MNKNNILNNISILILLLLILVFSYISINNNNNVMIGGGKCDELKEIVNKIMKKDKIYNIIFGNMVSRIIYIIILIVLIVIVYKIGLYMYKHEGIVIGGYKLQDGMLLSQYAGPFFKKFTKVTDDKYMFNGDPTKISPLTTQEDINNYDSFIKELRSPDYKGLTKTFCNKVKPFDPCICEGAKDTPAGRNGGNIRPNDPIDYFAKNSCTKLTNEAQKVIDQKKEATKHFFGIIPKCCCKNDHGDLPTGCNSISTTIIKGTDDKPSVELEKDATGDCANVDCTSDKIKLNLTPLSPNGVTDMDAKQQLTNVSITQVPSPIETKITGSVQGTSPETYTSKVIEDKPKNSNILSEFGKFLVYYIS